MPRKLDAVFQQRDAKNSKFVERVVSGSNLLIQTDQSGVLIGSTNLPSFNISGSVISASGLFISGPTNINPNGPTVLINSLESNTGSFDKMYINPNGDVNAPVSINSYGSEGELRTDDNFLYLYLNGKWRRTPFSLF